MSDLMKLKNERLKRRRRRVRSRVTGTAERPRLSVFRSSKHISVQLIDDGAGRSLLQVNDRQLPKAKRTKSAAAEAVGILIAERAKTLKITKVVFDRGGRLYHGRVKALAEAARQSGLKF